MNEQDYAEIQILVNGKVLSSAELSIQEFFIINNSFPNDERFNDQSFAEKLATNAVYQAELGVSQVFKEKGL